jgi:hypothetical protein
VRPVQLACLYQEGVQLELLGDPPSLEVLGKSLQAGEAEMAVELLAVPAAPWDGSLRSLVTQVTSGPVSIHHDGQRLTISGGAEPLSLLGRNISWFAKHADMSDPTDHIHLEHIRDSDHYMGADALPLIVRLFDSSP